MEAVDPSKTANNPFSAVQDLLTQSQQFWQERAGRTAGDLLELYKAGLEYTTQLTTITFDAARRSFDLLAPRA